MQQELMDLIRRIFPQRPADTTHITNESFVRLQKHQNTTLFQVYQRLCDEYQQGTVNQQIGKLIKEMYGLPNTGRATANGTAKNLIKSYTKH